jgi:hypothetical protein
MSSSSRLEAFKFALRATVFLAPLITGAFLFEVAMYRTRDSWPITKVIAAQENLKGESIWGRANFSQQYNLSKSAMIRRRNPRILALGSSRVMEFRGFMFHPYEDSFYNAGGLIQTVNDLAEYARQVTDGRLPRPQVIIVGIDPWWLSEATAPVEQKSWLDGDEDAAYSFAGHVEAARYLLRAGKSNFPWLVGFGSKPATSPFYDYHAFGITAVVGGIGERFSDGSYLYTAQLVDFMKHPSYRDRLTTPVLDQVKHTSFLFQPSSKVESRRAVVLRESLKSLKALGIEVYAFQPPFSSEVLQALNESRPLARFWWEYKNDLREQLKQDGIDCLPISSARDYGLDDRYMLDGMHPGEIYDSYIVAELVRRAAPGSLLSSVDLTYLANLRKKDNAVPLCFYPPPNVNGISENKPAGERIEQ